MSLSAKVFLAQLPLIGALAAVGVLAVQAALALGRSPETILQENYRSVLAAERMKMSLEHMEEEVTSERSRGHFRHDAGLERGQFEAELKAEEGNITEAGEDAAALVLRQRWEAYQGIYDEMAGDRGSHEGPAGRERRRAAFEALQGAADLVITINQEAMVRKSALAEREARRAARVTIATSVSAFLLALLLSATMTARMLGPLRLLARAVSRVGEGDFDVRVLIATRDEFGQLAAAINLMAEHLEQYRQSSLGQLVLAQNASRSAIDSIADPVLVFDTRGAVLIANDAAEALLFKGSPETRALDLGTVAPEVRATLKRVRDSVLGGQAAYVPKGFEESVRLRPVAGPERDLLPRATAVRDSEGRITGAAVILQDVTSLRLAYELRNDLVATVAHEFRTPLTSLRLAIHLCIEEAAGPVTDKQKDLLLGSREECERLQDMVDKLLDLARLQGGRVVLRRAPVSPEALVRESLAAQESAAAAARVSLRSTVVPGIGEVVVDEERTALVFSNLIGNAVRHSEPGASVHVKAMLDRSGAFVRFEVSDKGGGIPKEYQDTLFDRFTQVPGRVTGGAGLGLSIAKEMVEAHGGTIGFESVEGQGSTFWFTLPLSARPESNGVGRL